MESQVVGCTADLALCFKKLDLWLKAYVDIDM